MAAFWRLAAALAAIGVAATAEGAPPRPSVNATAAASRSLTIAFTSDLHGEILPLKAVAVELARLRRREAPDSLRRGGGGVGGGGGPAASGGAGRAVASSSPSTGGGDEGGGATDATEAEAEAAPPVLLLDAGDAFVGSAYFAGAGPVGMGRVMGALGYTAMAIGNHDLEVGVRGGIPSNRLKKSVSIRFSLRFSLRFALFLASIRFDAAAARHRQHGRHPRSKRRDEPPPLLASMLRSSSSSRGAEHQESAARAESHRPRLSRRRKPPGRRP